MIKPLLCIVAAVFFYGSYYAVDKYGIAYALWLYALGVVFATYVTFSKD